MQNKLKNIFVCTSLLLGILLIVWGSPLGVRATDYENPTTKNGAQIIDDAGLFSQKDKEHILESLLPFTEYGNALVATTTKNDYKTVKKLAVAYYDQAFGIKKGSVLLIDMDDREIYWYSEGDMYDILSIKSAMAITDNVYKYASKGDYASCASQAFEQATTVIRGGRIRQNMKYYGNALLALIIAIFINYIIVKRTSFIRSESDVNNKLYERIMNMEVLGTSPLGTETKEFKSTQSKSSYGSGGYSSGGGSSSSYSSGSSSSRSSSGYSSGSSSSRSSSSYSSGSSSSRSSSGSSSRSSSSSHRGGGAGHRF